MANPEVDVPSWAEAVVRRVLAARGDAPRIRRIFDRNPIPMLMVDGERRYVLANTPARLAFRQSLASLRQLRIEDLTPPDFLPVMQEAWERLLTTGLIAGVYEVASPEGTMARFAYCAFAGALPDHYVIVFAPEGWDSEDLVPASGTAGDRVSLTARELEVLQLAADGLSSPRIAEELVVSPATVRTHFEHIYAKLEMHERAGAVAKALRLGLIG